MTPTDALTLNQVAALLREKADRANDWYEIVDNTEGPVPLSGGVVAVYTLANPANIRALLDERDALRAALKRIADGDCIEHGPSGCAAEALALADKPIKGEPDGTK